MTIMTIMMLTVMIKMFRILLAIIFVMMHGSVMLGSHYVLMSGGRADSGIGAKWMDRPPLLFKDQSVVGAAVFETG